MKPSGQLLKICYNSLTFKASFSIGVFKSISGFSSNFFYRAINTGSERQLKNHKLPNTSILFKALRSERGTKVINPRGIRQICNEIFVSLLFKNDSRYFIKILRFV